MICFDRVVILLVKCFKANLTKGYSLITKLRKLKVYAFSFFYPGQEYFQINNTLIFLFLNIKTNEKACELFS